MSATRLPRLFVVVFTLGAALMLGFDVTITRILGVACLFAALALGVASIATPEFLAGDADENADDD